MVADGLANPNPDFIRLIINARNVEVLALRLNGFFPIVHWLVIVMSTENSIVIGGIEIYASFMCKLNALLSVFSSLPELI